MPFEVTVYEIAKRFHALPSAVLAEPAVLMSKISVVIASEGQVAKMRKRPQLPE